MLTRYRVIYIVIFEILFYYYYFFVKAVLDNIKQTISMVKTKLSLLPLCNIYVNTASESLAPK